MFQRVAVLYLNVHSSATSTLGGADHRIRSILLSLWSKLKHCIIDLYRQVLFIDLKFSSKFKCAYLLSLELDLVENSILDSIPVFTFQSIQNTNFDLP